mmetsp:Transcript_98314/g.194802  ORF Transcript_98314/g.194802 Transcript_98314/m.194802 type:complete len:248 (-) Transcript_98314:59-802(-)
MVEGIGDEVWPVAFTTAIVAVFIPLILRRYSARRLPTLHPDAVDTVTNLGHGGSGDLQRTHSSNDCCPICLHNLVIPVESSCGHWFCATCILAYWHASRSAFSTLVVCPCCRSDVTMFFLDSRLETGRLLDDQAAAMREVNEYNLIAQRAPWTISRAISDTPVLLRRLILTVLSRRSLVYLRRARILLHLMVGMICLLLQLVYVAAPVDVLPEGTLGVLGFLDDILLFLVFLVIVGQLFLSASRISD